MCERETAEAMHEAGWSVAVHNDYRLNGRRMTFWLWTHPSGRWLKGEGQTDDEALAQCVAALRNAAKPLIAKAREAVELRVENAILRADLARLKATLESIRQKLSYAGQDAVSSAVAQSNLNIAHHECVAALGAWVITPLKPTEQETKDGRVEGNIVHDQI